MKLSRHDTRREALQALKAAVIAGTSTAYDRLVDAALQAGATDDDIDQLVHEVLHTLLLSAEQPVTARDLVGLFPAGGNDRTEELPLESVLLPKLA